MDMMLPIWPWARRCIQTKKPMISATGSRSGSQCSRKFGVWVFGLISTPSSRSSARSASGNGVRPVVVKLVPSLNLPVMWASPFVYWIDSTWPFSAWSRNVE